MRLFGKITIENLKMIKWMVNFKGDLEIYHWKQRCKEINGKKFEHDLLFTIESGEKWKEMVRTGV